MIDEVRRNEWKEAVRGSRCWCVQSDICRGPYPDCFKCEECYQEFVRSRMANKKLYLLDPGHGKDTPGKRSPVWADKSQLEEYEFNRDIVRRLVYWGTKRFDVRCINLVPEINDVPLGERVRLADEFLTDNDCIYISIHANAASASSAHGIEIFTSYGQDDSDKVATIIMRKFDEVFPRVRKRRDLSDGDDDKEANFRVIRDRAMPAVLIECGFMTNEQECRELLMADDGRHRIVEAILAAMKYIDENGLEV